MDKVAFYLNQIEKIAAKKKQSSKSPRKKKDKSLQYVDKIKKAGNTTKMIELVYTDKKGITTRRKIEPYKISGNDFWGYDPQKESIRRFKIPQISGVKITNKKYQPRWDVQMNFDGLNPIQKTASLMLRNYLGRW